MCHTREGNKRQGDRHYSGAKNNKSKSASQVPNCTNPLPFLRALTSAERRLFPPARINIDVMAGAAKMTGPTQRISFRMHADIFVELNDL